MGIRFELFKPGRDGGIDLRNCLKNENIVVQCKHFFNTPFRVLMKSLEKEKIKVADFNPTRYIVATSCGLTPNNKNKILSIFSPYCHSGNDIYGRNDILKLLKDHEKVAKQNFKLWFTSESILKKILHSKLINQTEIDLENFQESVPKLVITDSYNQVQKNLDKTNTCIICGQPGIGKSTLMRLFVLRYIADGYEPIKISQDIREAYSLFSKADKQIFYYDDFLGQIFLENHLEKNEDMEICSFIQRINKMPNKKIILATREYIFNQALDQYEKLQDIKKYESIISLTDFSIFVKARILYNHLWHSKIENKNVEELLEKKNYLKIIQHQHFNPRIIEWMTLDDVINCDNYLQTFLKSLDHPERIWNFAFDKEISKSSRILLLVLVSYHTFIGIQKGALFRAYKAAYFLEDKNANDITCSRDFEKSLHELDGTFLKPKIISNGFVYIEFSNPSIREYVQLTLIKNKSYLSLICKSIVSSEQVECIWSIIDKSKDRDKNIRNLDFDIYLESINRLLNLNYTKPYPFSDYEELVEYLIQISRVKRSEAYILATTSALTRLIEKIERHDTGLRKIRRILNELKEDPSIFFIDTQVLMTAIKNSIISSKPSTMEEFDEIVEFFSETGITLEPQEFDNLKDQVIYILDKGLSFEKSEKYGFDIYTYNVQGNFFSQQGTGIEKLENIYGKMKKISEFFDYSMDHEVTSEIEEKINEHYDDLLDNQEIDDVSSIKASNDYSDYSIDDLFETLNQKDVDFQSNSFPGQD